MITLRDWIKVTDCIIRQVSPRSLQRLKAHFYDAREQRRCKNSTLSSISSGVCLGFFPPSVISGTAPQSVLLLLCSCLFLCISPSRPPSALIWDQQDLTSRAVSGVFFSEVLFVEKDFLKQDLRSHTRLSILSVLSAPLIFWDTESLKRTI